MTLNEDLQWKTSFLVFLYVIFITSLLKLRVYDGKVFPSPHSNSLGPLCRTYILHTRHPVIEWLSQVSIALLLRIIVLIQQF